MKKYNQELIDQFNKDGYIFFENALSDDQLLAVNEQLAAWVEESKSHNKNFGEIMDGRPRFDLELKSHTNETPAVRRITSPAEI